MKAIAKWISKSPLFTGARELLDRNLRDWNLPLTALQKLWVGSYMILRDYGEGLFPPRFPDEQTAFMAEKAYFETLLSRGKTEEQLRINEMRKPFWHGPTCKKCLQHYVLIQSALIGCQVNPPSRLLEVGCGSGWLAEFLSEAGFSVVATNLDPASGELVDRRKRSMAVKCIPHSLEFRASPMEYVDQATADLQRFDAVYVYEALHHAHDWKKALAAFAKCLRPGGWCFVFNEPNVIHTFVSYRAGKLSNTHEIGINPAALKREFRRLRFDTVRVLKNRMHGYARPIWVAAQLNQSPHDVSQ